MGNGAWGSTLGGILRENKLAYRIWNEGQKIGKNTTIIGALPTQIIRKSISSVEDSQNILYINCAKGIEKETYMLPYQIVTDVLGKQIDYFTLIGPSFSGEVKKKMPTLVNLGYRNESRAQEVKKLFQTDYFRVKLSKSVRALEFSGAFKNVYAIACGIADGLGFEMNTRVKLMVLAMYELDALINKLGYKIDKNGLPATVGDLILTCNSSESRNFSFGKLIVKQTPQKALSIIGQTVEGYFNAESIPHFEKETGLSLPLARFVYEVLYENPKDIRTKFEEFVKNT